MKLHPQSSPPLAGPNRSSGAVADPRSTGWLVASGLGLALLWSYFPALQNMAQRWSDDPQYSHGFLVPLFAALILWFRRERLRQCRWEPSPWGLALLLAGAGLRLAAARMDIEPLDAFSLLPTLAGCVWLAGGTSLLLWAWPAIAFLGFMLPLPFALEVALAHPLRRLATVCSTYLLQTFGLPALAEGNIILIDRYRLGVADACSGLGMMMTFFALSAAMALVVDRPLLDRVALVVGAVPIALLANIVRITATALAFRFFGQDVAQAIFHDLAGWLMMPLALGLLWLELRFLDRLLIPAERNVRSPNLPLPVAASTGPPIAGNS